MRGISAARAQKILLDVAEHLRKRGGPFTRAQARDYLMTEHDLDEGEATGIVFALLGEDGVATSLPDYGMFQLSDDAAVYLKNREWRFTIGRLNVPDAQRLVAILEAEHARVPLTGKLLEVVEKTRKALKKIRAY